MVSKVALQKNLVRITDLALYKTVAELGNMKSTVTCK